MTGSELWMSGIAVFVLLVVGALFSLCETALTAASRARLAVYEKEGSRSAALFNRLRERKDDMLSAMLLGNNLVNILASSLTTSVMLAMFGDVGIAYATAIMTVLVLIFGEVLPKTYAFHHADMLAMRLAGFIKIVVTFLGPVVRLVNRIGDGTLRLLGLSQKAQTLDEQVEELRGAIELHQAPTEEVTAQRAMLRSILDLADVTVAEIMSHRQTMEMLDIDTPLPELVESVFNSPYTRFPVYKDDAENIVGMLHARTFLKAWHDAPGADHIDLQSLLTEPWYVPATTTLFDQLQAFRDKKEHIALVVDEYSALMGVVALEDILEEIVGDIMDEKDIQTPGVQKQADNSIVVDGTVTIRDLNRDFEWDLPSEDYSTVAGLLLNESKTVPTVGQMFTFFGFRFKILKRERNQITLVRIYPPATES